jgi:predicted small lipoprotein YifL
MAQIAVKKIILISAIALALAACGKRGPLEPRPQSVKTGGNHLSHS